MRHFYIFFLLVVGSKLFGQTSTASTILLEADTRLKIALEKPQSLLTRIFQEGDCLDFIVMEAVQPGAYIAIAAGARVKGRVCAADEPDAFGKQAVWFELEYVLATDRRSVLLDRFARPLSLQDNRSWNTKTRLPTLIKITPATKALLTSPPVSIR